MSEVVVYATQSQAATVRAALAAACAATGVQPRLELFGSGSLFQRLRTRRAPPHADVVLWSGPFAAQSAAGAGLLQAHQPAALPERAVRHPEWLWTAVEFQPFRAVGMPQLSHIAELTSAPRLALADPERSEVGLSLVLATLDRARQVDGDPETAWAWWTQRVQAGIRLEDDDEAALMALRAGRASHALTLGDQGAPVLGLPPLPHAIALAANAANADEGRRLIDWLTSDKAPPSASRLSAWRASDGLQTSLDAATKLDVEWCTQQYAPARRRWAQSGFAPALDPA